MGKEHLDELKFAIFKNWLDTRPKSEAHEPNVYPTILGGVSRGLYHRHCHHHRHCHRNHSQVFVYIRAVLLLVMGRIDHKPYMLHEARYTPFRWYNSIYGARDPVLGAPPPLAPSL